MKKRKEAGSGGGRGKAGGWVFGVGEGGRGCIQEQAVNLPDATAMPEGAEYRREQRLERERGEARGGGGDCCLGGRSGGGGRPAWGGREPRRWAVKGGAGVKRERERRRGIKRESQGDQREREREREEESEKIRERERENVQRMEIEGGRGGQQRDETKVETRADGGGQDVRNKSIRCVRRGRGRGGEEEEEKEEDEKKKRW